MSLGYIPNWGRRSTSTGYEVVHCPEHPRAWSTGYVYTHTIVAEQKLNRLLQSDEIVHHIDGNRKNNNPENLEITNRNKHGRDHSKRATIVTLICPTCRIPFKRRRNQTHLCKGGITTFCSRKCNGIFQRKEQLSRSL